MVNHHKTTILEKLFLLFPGILCSSMKLGHILKGKQSPNHHFSVNSVYKWSCNPILTYLVWDMYVKNPYKPLIRVAPVFEWFFLGEGWYQIIREVRDSGQEVEVSCWIVSPQNFNYSTYGCFLKWWYPTTMGFPTKNDHSGVFWGYHHLRKHPYIYIYTHMKPTIAHCTSLTNSKYHKTPFMFSLNMSNRSTTKKETNKQKQHRHDNTFPMNHFFFSGVFFCLQQLRYTWNELC